MQTVFHHLLLFSTAFLITNIPVVSHADSTSVDDFTAIVNTGTVNQTTLGSGNTQNLNVGSATGTKAKSFNANVTTGTITQSSSGSGIVQSTNIGSATNSKVGSFNATVNTGNIEQIANQSGMRQELDIGSVTNSTVSGAVNTNVTIKQGVSQTGAGAIAIGSVKNANVQNFSNTIDLKGKVSGNNIKIGSVVGQSRYDNKGRYAGEEQVGDSGTDNNSLKLPNFPTTGGGGTGIGLTGQGTTNAGREGYSGVEIKQAQTHIPLTKPSIDFIERFYRVDDYATYHEDNWFRNYVHNKFRYHANYNFSDAEIAFLFQIPFGLFQFESLKNEAIIAANKAFPKPDNVFWPDTDEGWQKWGNLGHNDAFRHAYWNARMTQEFGESWTRYFTTAHESIPTNEPAREIQDLYNNEVGRTIGSNYIGSSPEEIARQIKNAVEDGYLIVVDNDKRINWSDEVKLGEHARSF